MIRNELYYKEVLNFLRTLTIKSDWLAEYYRKQYNMENGLELDNDPGLKNPYFLHLAGIYTDPTQFITANNNFNEPVYLTVEYFQNNPSSHTMFKLPNQQYDTTERRYSEERDLLKAIVYPIEVTQQDIDEVYANLIMGNDVYKHKLIDYVNEPGRQSGASGDINSSIDATKNHISDIHYQEIPITFFDDPDILSGNPPEVLIKRIARVKKIAEAENYTLLSYDADLLEEWERNSIIQKIKEFLNYFRTRWSVKEFTNEDLYGPAEWSILWYYLFQYIHTVRVENVRTSKVHSYHIWEYLRSNGLESYEYYLNREQSLFLYNNLRYLIQNQGKNHVLKKISDNLMEPYNVEALTRLLLTDTSHSIEECKKEPQFVAVSIGGDVTPRQYFRPKYQNLNDILYREDISDLEPLDQQPSIENQQEEILTHTPYTKHDTPLIEFDRIPRYTGFEELYIEFYLSTFLHEWHAGRLNDIVSEIQLPYYPVSYPILADMSDLVYLMLFIGMKMKDRSQSLYDVPLPSSFNCINALRTPLDVTNHPYSPYLFNMEFYEDSGVIKAKVTTVYDSEYTAIKTDMKVEDKFDIEEDVYVDSISYGEDYAVLTFNKTPGPVDGTIIEQVQIGNIHPEYPEFGIPIRASGEKYKQYLRIPDGTDLIGDVEGKDIVHGMAVEGKGIRNDTILLQIKRTEVGEDDYLILSSTLDEDIDNEIITFKNFPEIKSEQIPEEYTWFYYPRPIEKECKGTNGDNHLILNEAGYESDRTSGTKYINVKDKIDSSVDGISEGTIITDIDDTTNTLTLNKNLTQDISEWTVIEIPKGLRKIKVELDEYLNFDTTNSESDIYPFLPKSYGVSSTSGGYKYSSIEQFTDEIDRRFEQLVNLIVNARGQANMLRYEAYFSFLRSITLSYTIHNQPNPALSENDNYPTFGDWLKLRPGIKELATAHDNADFDDEDINWYNFGDQIVKRILPIRQSHWVGSSALIAPEYRKMMELTKKLTSYNISFLKQKEEKNAYWRQTAYLGLWPANQQLLTKPVYKLTLQERFKNTLMECKTHINLCGKPSMFTSTIETFKTIIPTMYTIYGTHSAGSFELALNHVNNIHIGDKVSDDHVFIEQGTEVASVDESTQTITLNKAILFDVDDDTEVEIEIYDEYNKYTYQRDYIFERDVTDSQSLTNDDVDHYLE